MSGASIEREAFVTSRQLDFVSESELIKQCGYAVKDWPLVIVKELVDNALDACEEQGIAPKITITVGEDSITIADNGRGISPGIVDKVLDFSVRVSSREAYVAPDQAPRERAQDDRRDAVRARRRERPGRHLRPGHALEDRATGRPDRAAAEGRHRASWKNGLVRPGLVESAS